MIECTMYVLTYLFSYYLFQMCAIFNVLVLMSKMKFNYSVTSVSEWEPNDG